MHFIITLPPHHPYRPTEKYFSSHSAQEKYIKNGLDNSLILVFFG